MTRFETVEGQQLGARFCSRGGAFFHLNTTELNTLWSLDENTEVVSDNGWFGTAGDLLDLLTTENKATATQMKNQFAKTLNDTLHMTTEKRLFLNADGMLTELEKHNR
jgi:hypothetical protein